MREGERGKEISKDEESCWQWRTWSETLQVDRDGSLLWEDSEREKDGERGKEERETEIEG